MVLKHFNGGGKPYIKKIPVKTTLNWSTIGEKNSRNQKFSVGSEMHFEINLILSDNKCPLFVRLGGGGRRKGTMSPFFTVFFIAGLP